MYLAWFDADRKKSVATKIAEAHERFDDAVRAFLALALVDVGREREAVSLALAALAPHLPRYQRSLGNYARLLIEPEPKSPTENGD